MLLPQAAHSLRDLLSLVRPEELRILPKFGDFPGA
jgi:hypothetical protein